MKRLTQAIMILNLIACGTDSKDAGATLVAAETETTTETEAEATTNEQTQENTNETETPTIDPDAYPIAEGFTKIAVSSYQVVGYLQSCELKFDVDFQCPGSIEIRAEMIIGEELYWVSYTVTSQPASWVNGYHASEIKTADHKESAAGYNPQSRVLYKCL